VAHAEQRNQVGIVGERRHDRGSVSAVVSWWASRLVDGVTYSLGLPTLVFIH
jgi:hypothetical protein